MASVTLPSKFQLSIPKAIREEMHLQAGQKFAVIPKGDTIVLVVRPKSPASFSGNTKSAI